MTPFIMFDILILENMFFRKLGEGAPNFQSPLDFTSILKVVCLKC